MFISSVLLAQKYAMLQTTVQQESRAIAGRTAWCRCKFRYVSDFTISR